MSFECYIVVDFLWPETRGGNPKYRHIRTVERKLVLPTAPYAGMELRFVKRVTDDGKYQQAVKTAGERNRCREDDIPIPIITGLFVVEKVLFIIEPGKETGYYHLGFEHTYREDDSANPHSEQLESGFGFAESGSHSLYKDLAPGW